MSQVGSQDDNLFTGGKGQGSGTVPWGSPQTDGDGEAGRSSQDGRHPIQVVAASAGQVARST